MRKALLPFVIGFITGLAVAAFLCWFWLIPHISPMQGALARLQVGDTFTLPLAENQQFSLREGDLQLLLYLPPESDVSDFIESVEALRANQEGLSVCYLVAPGALVDRQNMVLNMQCEFLTQADFRQKTPVWWLVDTNYRILCRADDLERIETFLLTR